MNTMPLEADTRFLIDKRLENLGWQFNGKEQNVFFERPKTENERKRLQGKRPDYVLYSKENDQQPLIVIEAKRKGERIDAALEQGIHYAKELNAPIVFATDGLFCKSYHTKFEKTPLLNGEEVDEFLREVLALKYLNTWEVNTISPKVQYDRKELIKIFDEANNMLRGDGLRAGIERFGEFANILFLKLISESEDIKKLSGKFTEFDDMCHWDYIKNQKPTLRIDHINKIVYDKLNKLYKTDIFTPLSIRDSSILKDIMDKLDPLMLTDVDSDVKGDAFEYFLKESTATKNDLGEYFTPRHIVKTMVKLVNPQIGEKIYDPFCGTGGFLIESFRHIYDSMPRNNNTETILRKQTIYGNEITNTARITKMNMILAGDGHSGIEMKDSLANPVDGKYDVVLANMPYSQKSKYGSLYDLPSTNGDSICVQHCMKAINSTSEDGRMALVVPEGFLYRKDLTKVREYLLQNCNLQSIISLPQGVFLPYTGVKTNIIYATKVNQKLKSNEKRKDYWYFEVKSDGYTLDNHRRKLETGSDLDFYQEYRKLDADQKNEMFDVGFELISLDKVKENNFILIGSRYRQKEKYETKYNIVKLKDLCNIINGYAFKSNDYVVESNTICIRMSNIKIDGRADLSYNPVFLPDNYAEKYDRFILKENDVIIAMTDMAKEAKILGVPTIVPKSEKTLLLNQRVGKFSDIDVSRIDKKYLKYVLQAQKIRDYYKSLGSGALQINISKEDILNIGIPLPSLDIQKHIVNELDKYQQVIDGALTIIENYIPKLPDISNYPIVNLGDRNLFEIISGGTPDSKNSKYWNGNINWITLVDLPQNDYVTTIIDSERKISQEGLEHSSAKLLPINTVVVSSRATIGRVGVTNIELATNQGFKNIIIKDFNSVDPYYLAYAIKERTDDMLELSSGATFKEISKSNFETIQINLPPLDIQQKIVEQITEEKKLVEPSQKLAEVFSKKIQDKIDELFTL